MKIRIFVLLLIVLSVSGCTTWKTPIRKECSKIVKNYTYERDVFDCKQFAPLTEEVLLKAGYKVEAVVGWYTYFNYEGVCKISGRHVWVRLIYKGKKYAIDTTGEKLTFQKEGYSVYNFHNYEVIRTLKEDKIKNKDIYKKRGDKIV